MALLPRSLVVNELWSPRSSGQLGLWSELAPVHCLRTIMVKLGLTRGLLFVALFWGLLSLPTSATWRGSTKETTFQA